eukprot:CAMPEP_0198647446 /NCGR_PEP_ID=MMETSP1467-20131203/2726_1 /TAXON_ID=1462469 /ORGANISM="unid. sp., Strain CCMP2135" /LENGTH=229 /DNA_ID=CAMNT_0044383073 /DNA_START=68 /DNA_END=754 /DNA_ORIENTATION=-
MAKALAPLLNGEDEEDEEKGLCCRRRKPPYIESLSDDDKEPEEEAPISLVRAHVYLVSAALIHSGYTVVLEANFKGNGTLSATLLSLLRDAIACPVLYAYSRTCEGPITLPHRDDIPTFLGLGILLGGFQLCLTTGVSLTNSDTAALFQSLEPTTATILATSLGFEQCGWRKVAAALLAGAGVVVLQFKFTGGGNSNPGGETRGESKYLAGCGLFLLNGILISTYTLIQ